MANVTELIENYITEAKKAGKEKAQAFVNHHQKTKTAKDKFLSDVEKLTSVLGKSNCKVTENGLNIHRGNTVDRVISWHLSTTPMFQLNCPFTNKEQKGHVESILLSTEFLGRLMVHYSEFLKTLGGAEPMVNGYLTREENVQFHVNEVTVNKKVIFPEYLNKMFFDGHYYDGFHFELPEGKRLGKLFLYKRNGTLGYEEWVQYRDSIRLSTFQLFLDTFGTYVRQSIRDARWDAFHQEEKSLLYQRQN